MNSVDARTVVALDVGGSSIKSALVKTDSWIVGDVTETVIRSKGSTAEILNTVATIITGHLQYCEVIRGIAFAFPGPFDYEHGVCWIQHQDKFDSLYGLDISANLREILDIPKLPIRYRNDAEAAILGEALYGAGAPFARLIGLTLGTGLGSAFISNGKAVTEGTGIPEHGWLYSLPYGDQRADDVFSTRGLLARLRKCGIVGTDIVSAIDNSAEDNEALRQVFNSFGKDLAAFLVPWVSGFRAEAVLVTGGIAQAWDRFAPTLARSLSVPVLRGTLGRRAALLGAAALYF